MAAIRFRDEEREVPDHIAVRLAGIETRRLTYDEAIAESNRREMADHLNSEQRRIVREHMSRWQ